MVILPEVSGLQSSLLHLFLHSSVNEVADKAVLDEIKSRESGRSPLQRMRGVGCLLLERPTDYGKKFPSELLLRVRLMTRHKAYQSSKGGWREVMKWVCEEQEWMPYVMRDLWMHGRIVAMSVPTGLLYVRWAALHSRSTGRFETDFRTLHVRSTR